MLLEFLADANDWIARHQALVVSVAIPITTLLVTVMVGSYTNSRAAKDRLLQLELTRRLKLADFRREWIEELRTELSELVHLTGKEFVNKPEDTSLSEKTFEVYALVSKIQMRLNPDDENFPELRKVLERCSTTTDLSELARGHAETVKVGRRVLKTEWERLKLELSTYDKKQ